MKYKITLHSPSGSTTTFHDCTVLERDGVWLRFNGLDWADNPVTVCTSMRSEIVEQ